MIRPRRDAINGLGISIEEQEARLEMADLADLHRNWIADIIKTTIDGAEAKLQTLNQYLYKNPELSFDEHKAHHAITTFLEEQGCWRVERATYGIKTSFRAEFGTGGRVVAFNAEYDALPGLGHACGHNLIATAGVAAGLALAAVIKRSNIPGRVVIIGTPAEELGVGKAKLIDAGAYKHVDACLMAHPFPNVGNLNSAPLCANLEVSKCYFKSYADQTAEVEYFGKASHAAAAPAAGKNALDAMVLAWNGISCLRQQTLSSDLIHGVILEGGKAANIIPAYTKGSFEIRSENNADLTELRGKMDSIFHGAAQMTGTRVKITWDAAWNENMRSNATLLSNFRNNASVIWTEKLVGIDEEMISAKPFASTDMGNVSHVVPSIHPWFAVPCEKNTEIHTEEFKQAVGGLEAGKCALQVARILASTGADVLLNEHFADTVMREFMSL